MKAYETSHPWISFRLDLRAAPTRLWLLLGEAASKCEHIAGVPLKPDVAARLHQLFLAKGALATTAIEGNTLSEEQVIQHLKGQLELPPSQEYLRQDVTNVVKACNAVWEGLRQGGPSTLSTREIKAFNSSVLEGLDVDSGVEPGQVRRHTVGVGRYRGAPPEDCGYLLDRLCDWLNGPDFLPISGFEIVAPIVKAVIAHLYLAWIHPFGDGNGRTARLVEFKTLVGAGVPTAAAHLLSNHYNQTRSKYYRELDRSSKSASGPIDFITYAAEGFVDQLSAQIRMVRNEQWRIAWHDYVHESFRNRRTASDLRRRDVVLALSRSMNMEPITLVEIANLTPALAASYATKTRKTLTRDIHALLEMGLIKPKGGGYRAAMGTILAFLPGRRTPSAPQGEHNDLNNEAE